MKSNQKRLKKTRFFIVFSYWKFSTSTSSFCFDIYQIWLTLVPILAMSQNLKLCYSPRDHCHSWRGRPNNIFSSLPCWKDERLPAENTRTLYGINERLQMSLKRKQVSIQGLIAKAVSQQG